MKIAIIGYGREGASAVTYWGNLSGNEITICDKNEAVHVPEGVSKKTGTTYLKDLSDFDLIIRSPGTRPSDIVDANSEAILEKVTTGTNEFFKVCPTKNIIGITGTKGKGTTSTLITEILRASGKEVHLGGNIGVPALDLLDEEIKPDDWVVLELSSFQLIDLKQSPHIGVCLLIVPEHLDWHRDEKEYTTAKQQLFAHQTQSDKAIYYSGNPGSEGVVSVSRGDKIPYFKSPGAEVKDGTITIDGHGICKTHELQLLGSHNWQNVCAAITAVWQLTQDEMAIREVVTTFAGLEHRLELLREADGVKYYNDSFSSVPDAAIAALDAITGKKVIIIGGFDRQLPLQNLSHAIKRHHVDLRKVVLIGASANRVSETLDGIGYTNYEIVTTKTMEGVLAKAQKAAQSGDSVILSPGFPSFDMFKDFEDRGLQFKKEVGRL